MVQYSGSGMGQQGSQFLQGQQMTQEQLMAARSSLLYAQQPFSPLPQHQPFHTQLGITSSTSTPPPPPLHLINTEPSHVGPSFPDFGRSNTAGVQVKHESGSSADARGGSSGEALYLKSADDQTVECTRGDVCLSQGTTADRTTLYASSSFCKFWSSGLKLF